VRIADYLIRNIEAPLAVRYRLPRRVRVAGPCNVLKGPSISAHKKSAIVKADRNPAVLPELYNLCYLTLQGLLRSPGKGFSDQPDPIANFETGFQLRFLVHLPLFYKPATRH
jgi:hypothetical protein